MTIVYIPRGEKHTEEINKISRFIEICKEFNPMEQNQYKTFLLCDVSIDEKMLIIDYLKRKLLIPKCDPLYVGDSIYLSDIGNIKFE